MRRLVRWVLALALVTGPVAGGAPRAAAEQDALARMRQQLTSSPVLRAKFHQKRVMQALRRPLIAEGRLIFAAGRGVFWRIEEPYPLNLLITPDAVVEWQGDGPARRTDMAANPFFRVLSQVFLAALAGDAAALGEHFDAQSAAAAVGWQLQLRPRDPTLASVIAVIGLSGRQFIDEVRIQDLQGDETLIRFTDFSTRPSELDETERAYFAH